MHNGIDVFELSFRCQSRLNKVGSYAENFNAHTPTYSNVRIINGLFDKGLIYQKNIVDFY